MNPNNYVASFRRLWNCKSFSNQSILINHNYTICNSFPIFCTLQILVFKCTAKLIISFQLPNDRTAKCLENKFTATSNKNEQGSTHFKTPTMFYILT